MSWIQTRTVTNITIATQLQLQRDRGLDAAEVAKHYLEESVWAKAIVTYIDKLSETPDQGA